MSTKNEFISIPKAAERCGVDRRTMWRWVKSNKIESFVTPGGHHRIARSEIENLLRGNRLPANPPRKEDIILVIDDDESVREALRRRLSQERFTVETVSDGFSAGMKVREIHPKIIILDLMMEGVDGFEVCRILRGDTALVGIKILAMTGFDTPENREKALREGADAYLPKSASFQTILSQIRSLLGADHYDTV